MFLAKVETNRPFAQWGYFTTTMHLEISAFGIFNLTGITKFKYERKNELNSGLRSKKTLSCKWPIECFHMT